MRKGIGIDLGGTNLRVALCGSGVVIAEPSMAAINRASGRVVKFGKAAEDCLDNRTPELLITRPFKGGVVNQCEIAQKVFSWCRKRCVTSPEDTFRTFISVPCCASDVEQSALVEVAVHAGYQQAYVVYAPLAALYGCGLDVRGGAMVVNIGASKTDIFAVHDGHCVYRHSSDAAGDMFDEAIVSYVLRKYRARLSPRSAERVKKEIGTLWNTANRPAKYVPVLDAGDNRRTVRIGAEEMFTIFEEPTAALMEAVCTAISSLPLDCVKSVFDTGILLLGGGAQLDGIDSMIAGVTGVRCRHVQEPELAVARGLEKLLQSAPENIREGCYNIGEYILK